MDACAEAVLTTKPVTNVAELVAQGEKVMVSGGVGYRKQFVGKYTPKKTLVCRNSTLF